MIDSLNKLGSENDSGGGGLCFEDKDKEGSSSGGDLGDLNDQTESITKGPCCYQSLQKKVTNSSKVPVSGPKPFSSRPKAGGSMLYSSPGAPVPSNRSLLQSATLKEGLNH